jgi:hypothetical protein
LSEAVAGVTENHPLGGVVAMIHGNYGSTAFDPFDGSHLEVVICDLCLTLAGEKGRVLLDRRARAATFEGVVVGYEELESHMSVWTRYFPGYQDFRRLTPEEFSDPPLGVRIFPTTSPTDPTPTIPEGSDI